MRQIVRTKLGIKGDTIVEVLVAIAVASAMLGSSFVVVNRTFQNARQAQEHEEALKLAEGQVERFKEYIKTPGNSIPPSDFCFNVAGAFHLTPPCVFNTVPGGYRMRMQVLPPTGSMPGEYIISVRADWSGPTGDSELVNIHYKVYQ